MTFPLQPPVCAGMGLGLAFELGLFVSPGSRVHYVRSTGPRAAGDPYGMAGNILPSIKSAMSLCASGYGDIIVALPGHEETIDSAWSANLVAGTVIVGMGDASKTNAPKLIWNATGSTIAVDVADVTIANFRCSSTANGVTEGIGVTGAGFRFLNNWVQMSSSASNEFTLFLDLEAGAHDALVQGNRMFGVTGPCDAVAVSGVSSRVKIHDNTIMGPTSGTAVGNIKVTGAALLLEITNNRLNNNLASSTSCINVGDVAATGLIAHNVCITANNGTASAQGVTFGAASVVHCVQNYNVDEVNKSGILAPAAAT